jgi:hypothetical protein
MQVTSAWQEFAARGVRRTTGVATSTELVAGGQSASTTLMPLEGSNALRNPKLQSALRRSMPSSRTSACRRISSARMPLFLTPELRIGIHQALEMYAADAPQPRRCHALRSPAF